METEDSSFEEIYMKTIYDPVDDVVTDGLGVEILINDEFLTELIGLVLDDSTRR